MDAETPPQSPNRNDLLRPEGFHTEPLELRLKQPASVEEEVGPDEEPEPVYYPLEYYRNKTAMDDNIPSPDTEVNERFERVAREYASHVVGEPLEESFANALREAQASYEVSYWELPATQPKEITMPCGPALKPGTPEHFEDLPLVEPICYRQNEEGEVCGLYAKVGCPDCLLIAVWPPRIITA
jgi:hypothetical protein